MVKYLILDFGKVLAYPTTGNWHITPKFLELVDIDRIDMNKLKESFGKYKLLLDRKIVTLEEEYNMFFELYENVLKDCEYTNYDIKTLEQIAHNRTYENDKYRPYNGIKEELTNLAKKYKLLLLSDNWPCAEGALKEYGIYDLFTKIYISSIYGQLKEDGLFFDNPIKDFNISSGDAIFIDDNEKLLDVAVTKGLQVKLMDRENVVKESKYEIIHDLKNI